MKRHVQTQAQAFRRTTLALALCLAAALPAAARADSKDGVFPTADQVGGQVFPKGVDVGAQFPTDWALFDEKGQKVNLAEKIKGKKSVIAFFISAVPVSVEEMKKLDKFMSGNSKTQLLMVNADTVGTALTGGPGAVMKATVRTVNILKKENRLKNPVYVAPNDALSPQGLSNRLGFRGLPTVFVIDARGKVEKIYVGPQQWKRGQI